MWERQWFRWLLVLVASILVAAAFATQLHAVASQLVPTLTWVKVFSFELPRWSLWALMMPLILLLSRRLPIERPRRLPHIFVHLSFSLLLSGFHLALVTLATLTLDGRFSHWAILDTPLKAITEVAPTAFRRFKLFFALDFHVGVAVYWVILISYQALESYRKTSRLESQLAQAQLQALKMQLHPHFLFNTLNSISALLHKNVEAADEMIGELGDFLRLTMENTGAQTVRLEQELEFMKSYLEIERVRFQDRLTVIFAIDPATLDAQVPNLILQPIIENAVRYAIAPRAEPGTIEVSSHLQNLRLQLLIKDNGPGLTQENGFKEGIGLGNTRARLRQLYDNDYQFQVANSLQGGLKVSLEIPFHVTQAASIEEII